MFLRGKFSGVGVVRTGFMGDISHLNKLGGAFIKDRGTLTGGAGGTEGIKGGDDFAERKSTLSSGRI